MFGGEWGNLTPQDCGGVAPVRKTKAPQFAIFASMREVCIYESSFAPPMLARMLQRSGTHRRYLQGRGRESHTGIDVDFPEGPGVTAGASRFLAVVFRPAPGAGRRPVAFLAPKLSVRRQVACA